MKEIKLSPNISAHDMSYRIKQANKFLNKGKQVKVSLQFKGRERQHKEIGLNTIIEFIAQCEGKIAGPIKQIEGKKLVLSVTLNPKGNK